MGKISKYKKGQKVYVDTLGKGIIKDSYKVKNEFLYHIEQGDFLLGNVPESWITNLNN